MYRCFGAAAAKDRLDVVVRDAINAGDIPGSRYLANAREIVRTGGDLVAGISAFADGPERKRVCLVSRLPFSTALLPFLSFPPVSVSFINPPPCSLPNELQTESTTSPRDARRNPALRRGHRGRQRQAEHVGRGHHRGAVGPGLLLHRRGDGGVRRRGAHPKKSSSASTPGPATRSRCACGTASTSSTTPRTSTTRAWTCSKG
jgi:hypothetical protein